MTIDFFNDLFESEYDEIKEIYNLVAEKGLDVPEEVMDILLRRDEGEYTPHKKIDTASLPARQSTPRSGRFAAAVYDDDDDDDSTDSEE
jgi:hypothetical protein